MMKVSVIGLSGLSLFFKLKQVTITKEDIATTVIINKTIFFIKTPCFNYHQQKYITKPLIIQELLRVLPKSIL